MMSSTYRLYKSKTGSRVSYRLAYFADIGVCPVNPYLGHFLVGPMKPDGKFRWRKDDALAEFDILTDDSQMKLPET